MKYLAYGSNLDKAIMKNRCREAKFLGTGVLEGYRLLFKGEEPTAYATIEQWEGFNVPYALWEISAVDEHNLDKEAQYPRRYGKAEINIIFNGEEVKAMYYAQAEDERVGQPMTHYIEVLEAAYRKYKFDKAILEEALRLSEEYYQRQGRE